MLIMKKCNHVLLGRQAAKFHGYVIMTLMRAAYWKTEREKKEREEKERKNK